MDVQINSSKLTDSPYSESTKSAFLFDDQTVLEQFVNELKYGCSGIYLLSGYRGSGKTSFVNRLAAPLDDFIFVELNIAKSPDYPKLLKKIIRQLYLQYKKYCKAKNKAPNSFDEEFQLLYDRTFNEIVQTHLESDKVDRKKERQIAVDLQKLIPAIVTFVTGTAFAVSMGKIEHYCFGLGFLISAIWMAVTKLTFTQTVTNTGTISDDKSRKSLYDDEIAEVHLLDLLEKIRVAKYKVLIVFDEIDKIEDRASVKSLINDLKPLFLSGHASFIVVAGQSLYYDLEKSAYMDDFVMSTLFARTIHVAFLKNATLKTYCLGLMSNDIDKSSSLVINYFDSLILQSGRIPRKLVNLVRSKLYWKDETAVIVVDESKAEKYEWLATLLKAITFVVDNELTTRARSIVQLDFFSAQVFTWLSKMVNFESIPFKENEIYTIKDYDDAYPPAWIIELDDVWEDLIRKLDKDDLIEIIPEKSDESIQYRWKLGNIQNSNTFEQATRQNPLKRNIDAPRLSTFLADFGQFENYFRIIFLETAPNEQVENLGLNELADGLINFGVIPNKWPDIKALRKLVELRNKIAGGQTSGESALTDMRKAQSNLFRLWAEINELYVSFIFNQQFPVYNANIITIGDFDIYTELPNASVAIDVKTFSSTKADGRVFTEAANKYFNFITINNKDTLTYGLFAFQPMKDSSAESIQQQFYDRVSQSSLANPNSLHLYLVNMSDEFGIRSQIINGLQQMIPFVQV